VATGNTQSITGGSYLGTYDSSGNVSAFTLGASDGSSSTFNKNSGSTFTYSGSLILAVDNSNSNVAVLVDPVLAGWQYQSYGVWVSNSPAAVAAISVGSPTVGSSIPTTSTATFSGGAGGVYYDSSTGASYATAANMTSNVNFATRSIGFSTSSTTKTNLSTGVISSATNQNLSGTLSYATGSNNISGSITSTGGMSGTAVGQFFGPSANEIGGTYKVNSGSSYMIGGFGGKR
jgi:phage baseplate assembly protein gpV